MFRRFTLGTEQHGYDFEITVESLHTDENKPLTLRVSLNRKTNKLSTKWQTNTKDFVFGQKLSMDGKFSYHIKNKSFGKKNSEFIVEGTDSQILGRKTLDLSRYIDYSVDSKQLREVLLLEDAKLPNLFVTVDIMYNRTTGRDRRSTGGDRMTRANSLFLSDSPSLSSNSGDPDIAQHLRLQINDLAMRISELQVQLTQSQQAEKSARREIEQLKNQLNQAGPSTGSSDASDLVFVDGMSTFSSHEDDLLQSIVENLAVQDEENVEEDVQAAAGEKLRLKTLETENDQLKSENRVLKLKIRSFEVQESRDSVVNTGRIRAGTTWS